METIEILLPSDLGVEHYQGDTLPEAVNEPLFVGFECLGCDGRHAQLDELIACQQQAMARYALVSITKPHHANAGMALH